MSHGKTYRFCHGTNINIAISSLDKGHEDRGHLRLAEVAADNLHLQWGEAFLAFDVVRGLEVGHEGGIGVEFAGEEAARGFLATAVEIGHGKVLLELVHNTEIFD